MRRYFRVGALLVSTLVLFHGCGGGNRVYYNRAGVVEKQELNLNDLPRALSEEDYLLGHGDVLDIVFLFNPELNQSNIRIRPDGKISLPYLDDIEVLGFTVPRLDSLLTEHFAKILVKPNITVIVKEFERRLVYVLGEVGNPGGFPMEKGMTILDALALGKGLSGDAKRNSVMVVRRVAPAHVVGIQVDLTKLIDEHRFDLDIPLEPFDIVLVPKSNIAKTEDFIRTMSSILLEPGNIFLKGWQIANVKTTYEFYKKTGVLPQ